LSAPSGQIAASVSRILDEVRRGGDAAVARFAKQFDGAKLRPKDFRVPEGELKAARRRLSAADWRALKLAHRSIADFNKVERVVPNALRPRFWRNAQGGSVGEKIDPIRRVGLYIPGGEAPLVSTVLMTATLARLAGCPEIAAFTPAKGGGAVAPGVLAALWLVGVREVYRIGGVQAIGAMAYGTGSIPAVDKIFGPGNAYVCEAKRQVFGTVGIDSLPGPSELMVIADASCRPDYAAADLLAQAEHGSGREKIFLVSLSAKVTAAVEREMTRQAEGAGRSGKIRSVVRTGFTSVRARNLAEAARIANEAAPEHLELLVRPAAAKTLTRAITTAGAIFIGNDSPTVLGDFTAGPSHVLPTGRAARFSSGLRVEDFLRRTSLIRYDRAALRRAAPVVAAFSAMEQLDAHGRSVTIRL
jgi:histidinol dehydrogenase